MKATKFNLVVFGSDLKCDNCGDEFGNHHHHHIEGIDLCDNCAEHEYHRLDREYLNIEKKVEAGEIEALPGEALMHEIHMKMLDLQFEYTC